MAHFAGAGRYFYLLKGGHSIGGEHETGKDETQELEVAKIIDRQLTVFNCIRW